MDMEFISSSYPRQQLPARRNGKTKKRLTSMPRESNLGACSEEYARSLADPIEGPEMACIPDYPALMTGRNRVWSKGTFSTSSNAAAAGIGFIVADGLIAGTNDFATVFTNAPAGASPVIDILTVANRSVFTTNSPYASPAFSPNGVQERIVSAELRIRYTGPELTRGGQIVGLHHPGHTCLQGYSIANMLSYKEGKSFPISREWVRLLYRPVDTQDLDFVSAFIPAGVGVVGVSFMAFIIQASDVTGATQQSFEFEFYANLETQGSIVVNKQPSHVDPVGHGAVNAISNMAPALHSPTKTPGTVLADSVVHAVSSYISTHVSNPSKPPTTAIVKSNSNGSHELDWQQVLGFGGDLLKGVLSIASMF
jgi:hypothetical protein